MPEYEMTESAPADDATSETPQDGAREPMDDEAVSAALKIEISDAEAFIDGEVSPQREQATEYYQGLGFGTEEEGRSSVVMTELRDAVTGALPSFMRALWGPEQRVEFMPISKEDVAQAEQETDYINEVVLTQDNPGFLHTYVWVKDGLVRTLGIMKWWWEPGAPIVKRLNNVSVEQLTQLMGEDGVELTAAADHQSSFMGVPVTLYDIEFTKQNPDGKAKFAPVPPEEYIFNRDARSQEEARFVAHRMQRTTSQLLELGISQADIDEFGGTSRKLETNPERVARNPVAALASAPHSPADEGRDEESSKPTDIHDYYEAYPYLDVDGDGVAELRRVTLLGPNLHVIDNEPADERPFALWTPDPEPHTMIGLSFADYLSDLQRISSFLMRGMLDSATATLNPRYEVVEDQVSIPDVLNHELGAPIRVKAPNMVRPLTMPFVGAEMLPILELVQSIKERRVGQMPAALDSAKLQSSTPTAVNAAVDAAQQRIELLARILAESGFKDLMKGLRRLIIKHQPRERMVRLRGTYVEVDPRTWDVDRDVRVNVALGLGFVEDRLRVLGTMAAEQKEWLDKLGPDNPLVSLGQYRATLARIAKLQGYPNSDEFFKPLPLDWAPPPAPPPPPDPAMLVAQAEIAKSQAEVERLQKDFLLKSQEAEDKKRQYEADLAQRALDAKRKDDLERDKLDAEITLRAYEMELKYQQEISLATLKADIERDREKTRASGRLDEARVKAEADARSQQAAKDSKPKESPAKAPDIHINVPEVKVPAPVVHIEAPKSKPRRHTAKKNADGTISITSDEEN